MRSISRTTWLNYLVLLYAFSIPVSLDLMRIVAPLIIVLWLSEGNMKEKFSAIRREPLFQAVGLLIAVLSLSLFWTDPQNLKFGVKYITRFWYLLPMLAIFTSLRPDFVKHVITAFLTGMTVSVIGSYLVYLHIIPFEQFAAEGASPFMHHTLFSIFLAFSIALLLDALLHTASLRYKLIYGTLFLLFTVNLFINIGRAGQLLFFILIPVVLISHYKLSFRSVSLTLGGIILSFFLIFSISTNFKTKMEQTYRNLSHISYTTSLGARVGLNIVAKDIIAEHPLFGVGAGDYLAEKEKIVNEKYPERFYVRFLVHYHNQYAEFAVIAGIFGLLAYVWILFQAGRIRVKTPSFHTLKYLFLATFILTSFIDAMFHLNRPLSLFALFAGVLLVHARKRTIEAS